MCINAERVMVGGKYYIACYLFYAVKDFLDKCNSYIPYT